MKRLQEDLHRERYQRATGKKLPDPEGDKRRKKREAAGKVRKSCRVGAQELEALTCDATLATESQGAGHQGSMAAVPQVGQGCADGSEEPKVSIMRESDHVQSSPLTPLVLHRLKALQVMQKVVKGWRARKEYKKLQFAVRVMQYVQE